MHYSKTTAVLLFALFVTSTGYAQVASETETLQPEYGVAKRGSFSVLVTKKGQVESAENVEVRCQTSGVILDIVPERSKVQQGDLLVKLSSREHENAIVSQKIAVGQAETELIKAKARLNTAIAAIEEYVEGTFVEQTKSLEHDKFIAEQNLSLLKKEYEVATTSGKTELELTRMAIQLDEATRNLELARQQVRVLEEITYQKMRIVLESEIAAAEVGLNSATEKHHLLVQKLENAKKNLEACQIRLPDGVEGTVFYSQGHKSADGTAAILGIGSEVSEGQAIISIPDLSNMIVNVHVNESDGVRFQPGIPARIRVLDKTFHGWVTVANRLNRRNTSGDGFGLYTRGWRPWRL